MKLIFAVTEWKNNPTSWAIIIGVIMICSVLAWWLGGRSPKQRRARPIWIERNEKVAGPAGIKERKGLEHKEQPIVHIQEELKPPDPYFRFPTWWDALITKIVHLIIVGGTNAGKTYTCKKVLDSRIRAGHKIVILDPHSRKNRDKWGDFAEYCVGFGRNFTEIEAFLKALLIEMSRRYDIEKNPFPITVVIEETPAIVTKCPSWKAFISEMAFEARKIEIHLIVVAQSDRVESLGIQGKGDLRDSLSFLRIGAKAIQSCPAVAEMRRGGSFQSQELENGVEKAVDMEDLQLVEGFAWTPLDFWYPEEIPDVKPIMLPGSDIIYGVRTLGQLSQGIAVEWQSAPKPEVPAVVLAMGEEYVRVYELMNSNDAMTARAMAGIVYPNEIPSTALTNKVNRMKTKIKSALSSDLADESGEDLGGVSDSVRQTRLVPRSSHG